MDKKTYYQTRNKIFNVIWISIIPPRGYNRRKKIVILPSELHKFVFCPKQFLFDKKLKRKPPLKRRILILIGKIKHYLYIKRGYKKEHLLEAEIPWLNAVLIGKPDAFKVKDNVIILEELKNRNGPLNGAWDSDVIQALAYAYLLKENYGKNVKITIIYKNRKVEVPYNEALLKLCLADYVAVAIGASVPIAKKSGKCRWCQYQAECK